MDLPSKEIPKYVHRVCYENRSRVTGTDENNISVEVPYDVIEEACMTVPFSLADILTGMKSPDEAKKEAIAEIDELAESDSYWKTVVDEDNDTYLENVFDNLRTWLHRSLGTTLSERWYGAPKMTTKKAEDPGKEITATMAIHFAQDGDPLITRSAECKQPIKWTSKGDVEKGEWKCALVEPAGDFEERANEILEDHVKDLDAYIEDKELVHYWENVTFDFNLSDYVW